MDFTHPRGERSPERLAAPVRRCPVCEGDLVNSQGLFACLDCGWLGVVARGVH
jgi:hypothetical protein